MNGEKLKLRFFVNTDKLKESKSIDEKANSFIINLLTMNDKVKVSLNHLEFLKDLLLRNKSYSNELDMYEDFKGVSFSTLKLGNKMKFNSMIKDFFNLGLLKKYHKGKILDISEKRRRRNKGMFILSLPPKLVGESGITRKELIKLIEYILEKRRWEEQFPLMKEVIL